MGTFLAVERLIPHVSSAASVGLIPGRFKIPRALRCSQKKKKKIERKKDREREK